MAHRRAVVSRGGLRAHVQDQQSGWHASIWRTGEEQPYYDSRCDDVKVTRGEKARKICERLIRPEALRLAIREL